MLGGFLEGLRGLVLKKGVPEDERRATLRLRCFYPVSCSFGPDVPSLGARVTEMSGTGMRLELSEPLRKGLRLMITYAGPHPEATVPCQTLWSRRRTSAMVWVGVRYLLEPDELSSSWVGYVLQELGFTADKDYPRRRFIRFPSNLLAELQTPRGDLICPVMIADLGAGGALLELPGLLQTPQEVRLSLPPQPGRDLTRLELLAELLAVNPHPHRQGQFLGNLKFLDVDRLQARRLGKVLLALMRSRAGGA